jgi:hypothetical protein
MSSLVHTVSTVSTQNWSLRWIGLPLPGSFMALATKPKWDLFYFFLSICIDGLLLQIVQLRTFQPLVGKQKAFNWNIHWIRTWGSSQVGSMVWSSVSMLGSGSDHSSLSATVQRGHAASLQWPSCWAGMCSRSGAGNTFLACTSHFPCMRTDPTISWAASVYLVCTCVWCAHVYMYVCMCTHFEINKHFMGEKQEDRSHFHSLWLSALPGVHPAHSQPSHRQNEEQEGSRADKEANANKMKAGVTRLIPNGVI